MITAWNLWDTKVQSGTGQAGGPVLQAGFFLGLVQAVASSVGTNVARGLWATLPGIVGSAPAPLSMLAVPGPSVLAATTEYTTAGTKSFTTPAGITVISKSEGIGGGGGGDAADGTPFGGGRRRRRERQAVNILSRPRISANPVVGAGTGGS